MSDIKDFKTELNQSNELRLVGYNGNDDNIVIPDGVQEISWNAFSFKDIKSVCSKCFITI
jgi:hypothetical protein